MSRSSIYSTSLIILSLLLALLWVNSSDLAPFSLQLTAGLILFIVLSHKLFQTDYFVLTESAVSTMAVVLIVTATGGFTAPFFFLNYFLLFELSILLEPFVSIVITLALMLFYLFSNQLGSSLFNLTMLFSFIFMTPLAYYSGKFYRKLTQRSFQSNILSNQ